MKKISVIAVLSMLTYPAFADDSIPSPIIDSVARDIAEKISEPIAHETIASDPIAATPVVATSSDTSDESFLHGVQKGKGNYSP